jgi:predicted CoA-binding protein
MARQTSTLDVIQEFLAQKRIAMIGISREPKSFSVQLFEELRRHGYDVVPVNPKTPNVLGQRCFARIQDVQPPVDAALLMTRAVVTEVITRDCAEAGIRLIWMYRAGGRGAVSQAAVEFCKAKGIQVIPGECPLMFLSPTTGVHRFHGFVRKITGRYPKQAQG